QEFVQTLPALLADRNRIASARPSVIPGVVQVGQQPQVLRIDAAPDSADVIDGHAFWDGSTVVLPGESVPEVHVDLYATHLRLPTFPSDLGVPMRSRGVEADPTPRLRYLDLVDQSFYYRCRRRLHR